MRLDKYLKVARIIKRRQVAKELADNDRIFVNNRIAKASTIVKVDDEIQLFFGTKTVTLKVLELKEHVNKEFAHHMFEILKEERNHD